MVRWIWVARVGERRGLLLLVEDDVRERGLLVVEERWAVARRVVVAERATPARGGRAMHRAPRMLGRGRER